MNKERRQKLNDVMLKLFEAKESIQTVEEEEQDAFDNMPEGLQTSENGEQMESNIMELTDLQDEIDCNIERIEELVGHGTN